jgi:putative Holliday junction resolvase
MTDEFVEAALAFGDKGVLLGLDLGDKTIGVACCDPARAVATPIETIRRTKLTTDAERLSALASARDAVGFVIGLPRNMDGTEGSRAQSTRSFGRNLYRILPLPVAYWDERLSTTAMERELIAQGMRRERRAEHIDAAAAAFILQGAIDRLRTSRRN